MTEPMVEQMDDEAVVSDFTDELSDEALDRMDNILVCPGFCSR